ncbi:NADH-dependent flavin oxidoreductase [Furfurilactobacillus siliginis]|nr:NADH-dependent flavin oxidoreductase [Furfurilactobacillus siliginis]GEK29112.1 NADH-dependent flavin oxidoreductase [Furfurilactobacillus siliginis]
MTEYQFLEPFTFTKKNVTLRNRVVIPPMTERMAFEDGTVTSDELAYYAQRANGAGLFITAVANVNAVGKGFEGELSVADDRFIPGLRRLAATIKAGGAKAILQIFSAGRMTNSAILRGQQPVSASAVAAPRPGYETPRALTNEEILQTITDFGEATRRAIEAGFDGVELHGANTYLIQQFFSPHSNRREDEWGGDVNARMRFPLAVIKVAQSVIEQYATRPFLLGYRLSPEEIEEPGITMDDTLALVDQLKETPLDYLHVSQSDVWRTSYRDKTSTAIINDEIKTHLAGKMPMIVVGNLAKPADVNRAAADYDLVALGHEVLYEPRWVEKVRSGDEDTIRYAFSRSELADLNIAPTFLDMIRIVSGKKGIPFTNK